MTFSTQLKMCVFMKSELRASPYSVVCLNFEFYDAIFNEFNESNNLSFFLKLCLIQLSLS